MTMKNNIKDFYKWYGGGAVFRFYGMSDEEIKRTDSYKKYTKSKKI